MIYRHKPPQSCIIIIFGDSILEFMLRHFGVLWLIFISSNPHKRWKSTIEQIFRVNNKEATKSVPRNAIFSQLLESIGDDRPDGWRILSLLVIQS